MFLGAGRAIDHISVALPEIRGEHDVEIHGLLWVVLASAVAQAVVVVAAGRAGDRFGRRPVFMAGLVVLALGAAAAAAAPGHGWLVAARVVEGVGAGILISGSFAIVRDAAPVDLLGRAFGLWAMVVGLGGLVGPILNGALVHNASWRWVLGVNAALSLVVLVLTPRFLPAGTPSTIGRPSIRRVLRTENYVFGATMVGLVYVVLSLVAFTLAFYLHSDHGSTPLEIGLVFAVYGLVYLTLAPYAGRLADRIGVRVPILIGFALVLISMIVFAFASDANNLPFSVVALSGVAAGVAFLGPATNSAAFRQIRVEDRSDASGLFWTARLLGGAVGVSVAALMLRSLSDSTTPELGVPAGYDAAAVRIAVVGAVIALVAMVITIVGLKIPSSTEASNANG
jgi:MFS family permease